MDVHDKNAYVFFPHILPQIFLLFAVEEMAEAVVSLDADLNYTYLNKKAAQLLGKQKEEVIGKNLWESFPEWENSSFPRCLLRQ